ESCGTRGRLAGRHGMEDRGMDHRAIEEVGGMRTLRALRGGVAVCLAAGAFMAVSATQAMAFEDSVCVKAGAPVYQAAASEPFCKHGYLEVELKPGEGAAGAKGATGPAGGQGPVGP